jgi:hypothetical protein
MPVPFVLYRDSVITAEELSALQTVGIAHGVELPHDLPKGSTIFTRFRSIPYGEFLQTEAESFGYKLANSWAQYSYIADVHAWKDDLAGLTPAVYTEADLAKLPEGEWFVKGETNSDKEHWATSCYAPNLASLPAVMQRLHEHPVVGNQNLVIRPFIHYRQLGELPGGQPIFNEWRVFVLNGVAMATGFYWAARMDQIVDLPGSPTANPAFQSTLQAALANVGAKASFVVFDLAERTDGTWDVLELNDGNMSGLAAVDPLELWASVASVFEDAVI